MVLAGMPEPSKRYKYVTISMTPELHARVVATARADRRVISDWARCVLEDRLNSLEQPRAVGPQDYYEAAARVDRDV
jgi:hypothetical protein